MAVIYSRPRIKIPKLFIIHKKGPYSNNKLKRFFLILCILWIAIFISVKAVIPIFNSICTEKAKSIATIITNNETTKVIQNYQYSDFIIIHKDDAGSIIMLESNMKNINYVISDVATKIQDAINQTLEEDVTISLGSFTGISLLSGRGYKIPIRISTIGNVKTNVKSEFISQGINQTLHRLYLEIESEISILTPFNTINQSISNQLLLAENVIVGNIPDTYYNLEGIQSSDAMQMMQ